MAKLVKVISTRNEMPTTLELDSTERTYGHLKEKMKQKEELVVFTNDLGETSEMKFVETNVRVKPQNQPPYSLRYDEDLLPEGDFTVFISPSKHDQGNNCIMEFRRYPESKLKEIRSYAIKFANAIGELIGEEKRLDEDENHENEYSQLSAEEREIVEQMKKKG